ncbi:MAG: flagellar assembly protein FliX [Alphaproteobacteria bacterium]|nr:flagellar assembly protein FliX [Alphaproteobacteria bacterium]OIN87277.1 MAG: flagellar assembly protein FliX [Alphaproteobacteria bacterium CG1_02_46_17]
MKIEGPNKAGKASSTNKTSKSGASGSKAFSGLLSADEAEAPAHTAAAGAIAGIDALLMAQESEDPTERESRKRMKERADDLLGELDKIKIGMLTGTLSVGNMIDIADVVASHRERLKDPMLSSLLDEIDLRAQIEIAKMQMALDASVAL